MRPNRVLVQYPAADILPLLGNNPTSQEPGRSKHQFILPDGEVVRVKINTLRLQVLKDNQTCVWCGRTGNLFQLERVLPTESPHLNLYHHDPRNGISLLLMTQDHILPVSKGGKDNLDNLWTMCEACNTAKGARTPLQFVLKMTDWPLGDRYFYPDGRPIPTIAGASNETG